MIDAAAPGDAVTEAAPAGAASGDAARAKLDAPGQASGLPALEPGLLGPAVPLSLRPFGTPYPTAFEELRPTTLPADVLDGGPAATAPAPPSPLHRRWTAARRAVVDGARWAVERWRASLQLRVAATTVLLSSLVVFVVGMLSVGTITAGVVDGKRQAAQAEVRSGIAVARKNLGAAPGEDSISISRTRAAVLQAIADRGTAAGVFSIVVISDTAGPFVSERARVEDVPEALRREVERGNFADIYTPVGTPGGGTTKGLVVGAPVKREPGAVELYYIFPLQAEQKTLGLVRNTVLLTGILLVALLAAVAALVTGQVVRPVRVAAATAERFAAGRLQERMQVRGTDDLSALAAAFNDMADSLQGQITKLEEMSRLQRRFTSDVSHELRTPLTTIRMATDVLHASRADFKPQVARSAELLENELNRFEALLADLLEISRYDAHVAVLEPDPIDLRGLVRSAVGITEAVARRAGVEVLV
ncbi:MAG TPA: HAMP domain-containing sensor histidine kinase, partial [Mycobacteriales bacterium]|nr:HAMP domain-containing sensor histidine kinase [Mycobacteriales bacterium]